MENVEKEKPIQMRRRGEAGRNQIKQKLRTVYELWQLGGHRGAW